MAICTASELVDSAKCFAGLPRNQIELVKLALLCKILQAHTPMATCNVSSLVEDAKCFVGLTPQQMQAVQIQLLCEILNSGGTGTTCIVCVDGDETPTDAAPCDCSIAYNQVGQFWFWHALDAAWKPFII